MGFEPICWSILDFTESPLLTGSCPYPPAVSADTSGGYGESKPKDDDFLSDKMTSCNRIYMFLRHLHIHYGP